MSESGYVMWFQRSSLSGDEIMKPLCNLFFGILHKTEILLNVISSPCLSMVVVNFSLWVGR